MKSNDAAELIAEIHEERAENEASDRFRGRAALLIALMAAMLAIGDLGGGNATDDMIGSNIKASDTWAFYQAKNVRQTMYEIEVAALKERLAAENLSPVSRAAIESRIGEYEATITRYDSEPDPDAPNDPMKGEGKKQLAAQARGYEAAFETASERDDNFDLSEVALQLALVLGSVAILAVSRWVLILSAALGMFGTLLAVNGFLLLVPLP
jgi:hypothetical protein